MTFTPTDDELRMCSDCGLKQQPPMMYRRISETQLSVARHYGGATIAGHGYHYDPTTDSLTRRDVLAYIKAKKWRQSAQRAPDVPATTVQLALWEAA